MSPRQLIAVVIYHHFSEPRLQRKRSDSQSFKSTREPPAHRRAGGVLPRIRLLIFHDWNRWDRCVAREKIPLCASRPSW